jgi:hypothetical protein
MASVFQRQFAGIRPAIDDINLDPRYAVTAHNARLRDSTLKAWKAPARVSTDDAATIYRLADNQTCCGPLQTWSTCVFPLSGMPSPNTCHEFDQLVLFHPNCTIEPQRYIYCTGEVAPLVVPGPTRALVAYPITVGTLKDHPYAGPDARAYTYTWVDKFGIESRPAFPSATLKSYDDETWRLTGFDAPPPNAVAVRIYRASSYFETGETIAITNNTSFQLVSEVALPLAGNIYDDNKKLNELAYGTLLTDENCDPPCMEQVSATQAGYAVGFSGNDIYFSERYEPHNWPTKYRTTLPHKIVALVVTGDIVFVGTTGQPFRINTAPAVPANGSTQVDLTIDPLPYDENYPCISRYAMVSTSFGAMYTTHKGLVALQPRGPAALVSRSRVDEDDWLRMAPNLAEWYNGKYYATRSPAGRGFIFDMREGAEGELDIGDLVTVDLPAKALHAGRDGHLYFSHVDGSGVYRWNAGPARTEYIYTSKQFRLPGVVGMSAFKVVADYGAPVKFELFADRRLVYTTLVSSAVPHRLPRFGTALLYQVRLTGTTRVREWHVGAAVADLTEEPR